MSKMLWKKRCFCYGEAALFRDKEIVERKIGDCDKKRSTGGLEQWLSE